MSLRSTPVRTLAAAALMAAVSVPLVSGCTGAQAQAVAGPPAGSQCEVQFQRQLLGAAADLPVSPTTNEINGAATSVSGKLKTINSEWVVLSSALRPNEDFWIPRSAVLMLRVGSE